MYFQMRADMQYGSWTVPYLSTKLLSLPLGKTSQIECLRCKSTKRQAIIQMDEVGLSDLDQCCILADIPIS